MAKIKTPSIVRMHSMGYLIPPTQDTGLTPEFYAALTPDQRKKIAMMAQPWFRPTRVTPGEDPTYNRAWWEGLPRRTKGEYLKCDLRNPITIACLFPERYLREYVCREDRHYLPVEFYTQVTASNALGWYHSCPSHLRTKVDKAVAAMTRGSEVTRSDPRWAKVAEDWGDRPELPEQPTDEIDGLHPNDILKVEVWKEWVAAYEDLILVEKIVEMAPAIQEERKLLSAALGLDRNPDDLPDQTLGLDPTQAATVAWIQAQGETPLEFLVGVYKSDDPAVKTSDKIAAARTLMDYVHKKVPLKQELETKDTTEAKLDPKVLKSLSAKELATLESILKKMNQNG